MQKNKKVIWKIESEQQKERQIKKKERKQYETYGIT